MVTRTKPRPVAEPFVAARLDPSEHKDEAEGRGRALPREKYKRLLPLISELLNLDLSGPTSDSQRAHFDSVFERCARRLLMDERVSLPAHTIAALEPIADHAGALAGLLDPWQLAPPVVRGLGIDHDTIYELRMRLTAMAERADREVRALSKEPSKGDHNALYSAGAEQVDAVLADLFESLRVDQSDDDPNERKAAKFEFIKLVRSRLPAAPAYRKRVKKMTTRRAK